MEIHGRRASLTREELYEQVWSTPMRKLAPTYGLSDVGLRKVCIKHKIPTPPVGYWAKKEFGKRVRQTPLPELADDSLQTIWVVHDPDPDPKSPRPSSYPVNDPDLLESFLYEQDPKNRIHVADHLRNPHPVIQRTREAMKGERDSDIYNHVHPSYRVADECASIAVGRESVTRALRLMDTLFHELEKRGHQIVVRPPTTGYSRDRNRVKCLMLGEEFGFVLREKTKKVPLSKEERQRDRLFSPEVQYKPSLTFELRITGAHGDKEASWTDGKVRKLEDQLNAVIVGMLIAIEKRRRWHERQRRQEAARLQREQEEKERERLRQIESARVEQFHNLAGRWQTAIILREFAEAVRVEAIRRFGQVEQGSGIARWLEWTADHIRSLDPLLSATLPSLRIEQADMR